MSSLIRKPSRQHLMYSNFTGEQFASAFVGSYWLMDKELYEDRSNEFDEEIGSFIKDEYDSLIEGMSSESISMSTARTNAVEDNWMIYQFFAQDDIGAPKEVFTYVNDEGEVVPFSDEQINQIENWEKGDTTPISSIEGHHIHPVNYYPENIGLAADPDNIVFATEIAHQEHLHSGDFSNYTAENYIEHDNVYTHNEMLEISLNHRKEEYMHQTPLYEDVGLLTYAGVGIASAALFTVVKMAFEIYQWRGSKFSNHQKKVMLMQQTIDNVKDGSLIVGTAVGAKVTYDSIFQNESIELLSTEILFSSFDLVIGFGAAQLTQGIIQYNRTRKKELNEEVSRRQLQQVMNQTMIEVGVFTGVGIAAFGFNELLESVGEDAAASLVDPTGVTAAAMVAYKGIKFGKKYVSHKKEKEAFQNCNETRVRYMLKRAEKENLPPA